jgi:hypothetical protein
MRLARTTHTNSIPLTGEMGIDDYVFATVLRTPVRRVSDPLAVVRAVGKLLHGPASK